MAMYSLRPHREGEEAERARSRNPLVRFQHRFSTGFDRPKDRFGRVLSRVMSARRLFIPAFLGEMVASSSLIPTLRRAFFPTVAAGQITSHVRAPAGTRIEDSTASISRVQTRVRELIPAEQVESVVANVGMSSASLNVIYNNTGTVGSNEGDILISLGRNRTATDTHVAT
ncbi:hypothetical protein OY671_010398, partial [Metschnikowia pulcherrima]